MKKRNLAALLGLSLVLAFGSTASLLAGTSGGLKIPDGSVYEKAWDNLFGTSDWEEGRVLLPLADGGVLAAGTGYTGGDGEVESLTHGSFSDVLLARFEADGTKLWDTYFGSLGNEEVRGGAVDQDGNIYLVGQTDEPNGGNMTSSGYGSYDGFVVKYSPDGTKLWDLVLGGTGAERLNDICLTGDGGFAVIGYSSSASGSITDTGNGGMDIYVARYDASRNLLWDQLYGGSFDDYGYGLALAPGGDLIAAGESYLGGGEISDTPQGNWDALAFRLDGEDGSILWNNLIGNSTLQTFYDLAFTDSGALLAAGISLSGGSGGELTSSTSGSSDGLVCRLNPDTGALLWDQQFGGSSEELFYSASSIPGEGSLLLAGYSWSSASGDVSSVNAGQDMGWIAQVSDAGSLLWERGDGGTSRDEYYAAAATVEAFFALGYSGSWGEDGTLEDASNGPWDFLLVRYSLPTTTTPAVSSEKDEAQAATGTPLDSSQLLSLFGVTAEDAEDGALSEILVDASAVDWNAPGSYTVRFSASDGDENSTAHEVTLTLISISSGILPQTGGLLLPLSALTLLGTGAFLLRKRS